MPDLPPSRVGTPLDRLVTSVRAWDKVPHPYQPDRPGLRYGVNSHVALAMIARWSRIAEIPIMTLAATLVAGAVENTDFSADQLPPDAWLGGRVIDGG
jgi:hypothetical protein